MLEILLVFLGGGLGSIARYLMGQLMTIHFPNILSLGTFTVNIIGSFIIGLVISLINKNQWNPQIGLLLATGFCGGFTTFSSFSYENTAYLKNNDYLLSFGYTIMSLFWGFAATFLGIYLVKRG
ncbi:CrcB protein [Gloeothece citriformis PCC 7424]|uniref:Fluoride-specific ion channel FluC n=1 Tax=Gloeothece citriformis (strain PCC 7424) TaxID=65393 RepID=FLUC_GLOC7|nr:fluoride efflux transporter CrcB [Gloeothece citriformis]B7KIT4.1 RecName: Full=Fluoride-specific ion channel FluC [Gloeothece citriformis PCC 7424]ACK70770.1 CrcB protein [Gloeothece citriformis PCC 7424]